MGPEDANAVRTAIATFPADVSSDAHGLQAPQLEEIFPPEQHAAALDPGSAIVVGSRGTGKSFWAGVLGDGTLRSAAARAYPRLGLDRVTVEFGFTGLSGPEGIDKDKLDACVPPDGDEVTARSFWWATLLRAVQRAAGAPGQQLKELLSVAQDIETREKLITEVNTAQRARGSTLCAQRQLHLPRSDNYTSPS